MPDVDPAVRAEGEADHVDGFQREPFGVPLRMHVEVQETAQIGGERARGHAQIRLSPADEQDVVHIEEHVGDEPVPHDGAVAPAAELGQAFGGEMVGV